MLIGLSIIALKLYIQQHNEKSLTFYSSENIYSSPQIYGIRKIMFTLTSLYSPLEGVAGIFSEFSANGKVSAGTPYFTPTTHTTTIRISSRTSHYNKCIYQEYSKSILLFTFVSFRVLFKCPHA